MIPSLARRSSRPCLRTAEVLKSPNSGVKPIGEGWALKFLVQQQGLVYVFIANALRLTGPTARPPSPPRHPSSRHSPSASPPAASAAASPPRAPQRWTRSRTAPGSFRPSGGRPRTSAVRPESVRRPRGAGKARPGRRSPDSYPAVVRWTPVRRPAAARRASGDRPAGVQTTGDGTSGCHPAAVRPPSVTGPNDGVSIVRGLLSDRVCRTGLPSVAAPSVGYEDLWAVKGISGTESSWNSVGFGRMVGSSGMVGVRGIPPCLDCDRDLSWGGLSQNSSAGIPGTGKEDGSNSLRAK